MRVREPEGVRLPPEGIAWAQLARNLASSSLVLGLAVLFAFVLLSFSSSPLLAIARIPPWPALLLPCAAALVGVHLRNSPDRVGAAIAVTALLAVSWFSVPVQPLGDHGAWRSWATTDRLAASELLGNLVHRLVHAGFGERALQYVAPVVGVITALAWFQFGERALVPRVDIAHRARLRAVLAVAFALGGIGIVFHRDYVENPMTSLPFAWLGLGALVRCEHAARGQVRPFAVAVAWLALATLVHGMNATLLAAAAVFAFVREGATWRTALRDLVVLSATVAVVVGSVVGLLLAVGFTIEAGHAGGGGDGRLLVPWTSDAAHAFGMLSVLHAEFVGNALLAACPLAFAALFGLFWRAHRTRVRDATPIASVLAACAGLSLLFLVHFDLGFPHDLDLMVGATAPILPVAVLALAHVQSPLRLAWLLALAAVPALLVAGALLVPIEPESPLGAAALGNAEPDALTANGRSRVCELRAGERVVYRLLAPEGAEPPIAYAVFVHRGLPTAPANGGRACMPLPGEPGHDPERTIVLCDGLSGSAAGLPPFAHSLLTPPMPAPPPHAPHVVQALLRDAKGREWTTNAVVIEVGS